MTSKIGSAFQKIGTAVQKFDSSVEKDVKAVGAEAESAAKSGGWLKGGAAAVKGVGAALADAGAEAIGVAETAGLRYPVSSYSSKVSDGLTRGARLEGQASYISLKSQGYKGIVDLTLEGTDDEKFAKGVGLNALNVQILDNSAPTEAQMKQFLDFATNSANEPCYVHCEAGKGRTGVAVACYRMAVEGWSPDQAIAEANKFGLALPNQTQFIRQFGADLAAGNIAGYPKAS
jgi:protein-tyrosine phosphatase